MAENAVEEVREFELPVEEDPYAALGINLKDEDGVPAVELPGGEDEKPEGEGEGEEKPDEEAKEEEKPDEEVPNPLDALCAQFAEKFGQETLTWNDPDGTEFTGGDALAKLAENGVSLVQISNRLNSSAESAEGLLADMTAVAMSIHADDLRSEAEDPRSLNIDDMSPVERALVGRIQLLQDALNARADDQAGALKVALERASELEAKLAIFENDPKLAEAVRVKYPEARLPGEAIRALMEKHEVKNPVKAYELELLETGRNPKRDAMARAGAIPSTDEKSFDPKFNPATNAPYTYSEMEAMFAQGYKMKD